VEKGNYISSKLKSFLKPSNVNLFLVFGIIIIHEIKLPENIFLATVMNLLKTGILERSLLLLGRDHLKNGLLKKE
jgi:hypothetical protein